GGGVERWRGLARGRAPAGQGDPRRPGFRSVGIWVTNSSPARIGEYREPIFAGRGMEPPRGGSFCRVVTFPPDATFRGKVGANEVAAFFRAMGSPAAAPYWPQAPHPYMHKTATPHSLLAPA